MSEIQRATCWSITINNPKDGEYMQPLIPGWNLDGQLEQGEEGTVHFQGILRTPQVRFSAVKKQFPRAHIEVAKNKAALQKYVHKEESRVAEVSFADSIPTLFNYQITIAERWDDDEFTKLYESHPELSSGDAALLYVDTLVDRHIRQGQRGVEYIAINPMWRSSWKKFYGPIVERERQAKLKMSGNNINAPPLSQSEDQSDSVDQENVCEETS